jgi:cytochrome c-type biogenesis protein
MGAFDVSYAAAAGAGLLSFLSPCVLPLIPAYLCYIAGTSLEDLTAEGGVDRALARKVAIAALAFVLGFSTVFVVMGASASAINRLIFDHIDIISKVAGAVIVIFGLHYMGLFKIAFLYREARFNPQKTPAGLLGAYVLGLAFAFGWTPCVGPILSTILAIAAGQDSVVYGVSLLSVYAAGLGIPFMIAALAVEPFMKFLGRFRRHLHKVEMAAGALLVVTGVLIFTDSLQVLSYWLLEAVPILGEIG